MRKVMVSQQRGDDEDGSSGASWKDGKVQKRLNGFAEAGKKMLVLFNIGSYIAVAEWCSDFLGIVCVCSGE